MPDYVHLIGAEQVQSAGNTMREAASEMQRAAYSISNDVDRLQRILDDILIRLDGIMNPEPVVAEGEPPEVIAAIDAAHAIYGSGNIDAGHRDYLIEKARRDHRARVEVLRG